jgi:hypothetical protein
MRLSIVPAVALAALGAGCLAATAVGTPGYAPNGSAPFEVNVDRPGSDYRSFDLTDAHPETCRDTCLLEPRCVAFTYMSPGVQGPSARCWLKSAVPPLTPNTCCISGVKALGPAPDEDGAPHASQR